ncbi:thiosulfate sulfurtransferase GlpE [Asticcacaulis sp. SL142]|uniref:thiosulfate sulfurtransferase GlpE n=1 Tax=Asticcacaulis sp. SL142 TaxID=2995155 RepID=UPI00226CE798|nr:thiosulfate sulfurtransferase GlpE [Asticcacaulis sp. SL142]WAC48233.1 thiosulfate sulfurtransferase GlpE [Asticcacaulis sp. SL142]
MVLAGATQTSVAQFVLLDTLGLGVLVGLSALIGAFFKSAISTAMAVLGNMGTIGAIVLVCALGLYGAIRMVQRQIFIHRLRMDRMAISEFLDLVRLGPPPVILDVRAPTLREAGVIPGALFAHPDEVEDLLKDIPKQIEVVVYCACPNEVSAAVAALHLRRAGFQKIRPLAGGYEAWLDATQSARAS